MENKPVFAIQCPDFLTTGKCNLKCKYCFEYDKIPNDIDSKLLDEYLNHNPLTAGFIFGGEPLMVIDKICEIIDSITNNPAISKKRKEKTIAKCKRIITNGTLIHKHIEIIKKYELAMQISMDGCKEAHDLNRVYANEKGSWDDCMKAIEICVENNIEWSIHGVVNKETLPYIFDSFKEFVRLYKTYKKEGMEFVVNHLQHNTFQIVFEENYTDADIDILIDQFGRIAEWIYHHEEMTEEQKEILFDNWFFKTGGTCSIGTGLMALDEELNIFPCHRTIFGKGREISRLGNVFKPEEFKNHHLYNSFFNLGKRKKYMYSVATQIDDWKEKERNAWFMWCPATNLQECENPYFQPVKYNIMFTELNRFIRTLRVAYFGERRFNNSSGIRHCKS